MQRDHTRSEVPTEASLRPLIEAQWRDIMVRIFDAMPYDEGLRFTEQLLNDREAAIAGDGLNPTYDWQYDLDIARFHHRWNLDHACYNEDTRDRFRKYWESELNQSRANLKDIALNGLKTILLIHGAVAVYIFVKCRADKPTP